MKYEGDDHGKDDNDGNTENDVKQLKTPRRVIPSLIDVSPAVASNNCCATHLPPTTVRYRCPQPPRTHARRQSQQLQQSETQPISLL